jgi:isopenicillin-N epimerase
MVTFLNHGSFGACPKPVFETYQRWQRELEREPVDFIVRKLPDLLADARAALGDYVGADADDLTFVPNATTAINVIARTLDLRPNDEVLATNLEYGACNFTWEQSNARYIRSPLGELFDHVTDRTRVLFLSHITSETGLLLPISQLIARGRELGLTIVVDGAHAPGQVPLNLRTLGADFYAGNCHKWLCAPKGAGFLWVAPEWQERTHGPIVSWGYAPERSSFLERTELQGTRDPAAYLSVPTAIEFVREHDNIDRSVALCREARRELCNLAGEEPIAPEEMIQRMATFRIRDAERLSRNLWEEHRIEIPWMRDNLLRISIAMYTQRGDIDRLLDTLSKLVSS